MSTADHPPFEVISPDVPPRPIIGHVPHASRELPADIRAELLIDDEELSSELLRLTDSHTEDLFAGLRARGATLFVNRLSRLVFDPERFLDAAAEPTEATGQGVVYTRGSSGQHLRTPDADMRRERIERLYRPYHAAFDRLVREIVEDAGRCIIIDCHSFPSVPLMSEFDQAPDRPDICIGSDDFHTPAALTHALHGAFRGLGLSVKLDSPFAGTFVPIAYLGRDARVSSVMIEVRRGLYMDEEGGDRLPGFADVASTIDRALDESGALY